MKLLSISLTFSLAIAFAAPTPAQLQKSLRGQWKVLSVSCDGKDQPLEHHYTLSFNGAIGAYISKASNCTQLEPEKYRYLPDSKIAMKQGVRSCTPNPCAADLPATECGKETNPAEPLFDVGWGENKLLVISTNDVNAIDCTGPGQKKPAVFKLLRIK